MVPTSPIPLGTPEWSTLGYYHTAPQLPVGPEWSTVGMLTASSSSPCWSSWMEHYRGTDTMLPRHLFHWLLTLIDTAFFFDHQGHPCAVGFCSVLNVDEEHPPRIIINLLLCNLGHSLPNQCLWKRQFHPLCCALWGNVLQKAGRGPVCAQSSHCFCSKGRHVTCGGPELGSVYTPLSLTFCSYHPWGVGSCFWKLQKSMGGNGTWVQSPQGCEAKGKAGQGSWLSCWEMWYHQCVSLGTAGTVGNSAESFLGLCPAS